MPDMLAKLYWKPRESTWANDIWNANIEIIRPDISDKKAILEWIYSNFHPGWMAQAAVAFDKRSIFVAVRNGMEIVGFACFDVVRKNFFGPMGVAESCRKNGVGTGLVLHCFEAMRAAGYEYAIIHAVGPVAFYSKVCGAEPIPDSEAPQYRKELKQ